MGDQTFLHGHDVDGHRLEDWTGCKINAQECAQLPSLKAHNEEKNRGGF